MISQLLNDIADNGKTATNDCPNTTGNDNPSVQNENSLEPQGFKRVSLGGTAVSPIELLIGKQYCFAVVKKKLR